MFTPHFGSSVCVPDRTIFMPSMMTHERLSMFRGSHSSPLTLPSLFLSTSSTPTAQITLPDQNTTAPNPRNEAYGSLAISQPLTVFVYVYRVFRWLGPFPTHDQDFSIRTLRIRPSAENVGESQGKCKNNALGK